jgi:glucose-6-phosphate isomerase
MQLNPSTSLIEPFGIQFDLIAGTMENPDEHIVRNASAMRGYYAEEAALERLIEAGGDPIHYETFESPIPAEYGHVKLCISKLYAGLVGDEYFMTKGHYHTVLETGEAYLCLRGQGLMMMKLSDGTCRWEPFMPGRLVYAPPYWAHRSINTGNEPLISLCLYPGDAGHNYGDIKTQGFPKRAFQRNGQVTII